MSYIIKQYVDPVDNTVTFAAFTPDLAFCAISPSMGFLQNVINNDGVNEPVQEILDNTDAEYDDYRRSLRAALDAPALQV